MPCRVRSTPRFFAVRNRVMPPESASPGAGKVAPVHATTNRTSGRWHTNGQQCQSNVYWHAANVGVKPKQLLTVPTEGALSGRCPSCQALAEQASAPLAAHPSVAARPHETQENIMDILNTSTSFPYNGHRFRVGVDDGQDLRLRPHRGLVARPLASPLRSRRADHCTKQLTHQLTTPAPRRTTAPTPRSPSTSKACAATLCNRRTRTTTRACCSLSSARVPPDCDGTVA